MPAYAVDDGLVASHDGARSGQPERHDVMQFGPLRPRRPPPRWLPAAVTVLMIAGVAAGVVVTVARGKKPPARPATATVTAPVTVTRLGHPLLGVRAGWDLFALGRGKSALGGDVLVRIQLARGRITRTAVSPLDSDGPVSFLAGPDEVIIRPLDFVPGYLVPDGQPARGLRAALSHGGVVFPGPRPGQLWAQPANGRRAPMSLIGPTGRKLGPAIQVPADGYWPIAADGSGYLLIHWRGAVYDARPGGRRRVTAGTVAAVGRRHRHRCADIVIDSATGARRLLARHRIDVTVPGAISPDGSTAALFLAGHAGKITIHLLSLISGTDRGVPVNADRQSLGADSLAWSPDSRWLFVAAAHGKLVAVNASTGRARGLGAALPLVSQLTVRAGPAG
jgi:hypothetical protein